MASRRAETIDAHVAWIHRRLLRGRPSRVLDLGCGPGLYSSRLARRGHECLGIDYSPASIAYARRQARQDGLPCSYRRQDIRRARYGAGFDLVMLISGEINVFRPADARVILRRACGALKDGGTLVLEPHTDRAVRAMGRRGAHWYSAPRGLFSDRPHLCLQEHTWEAATKTATIRYFVVDAASGRVTRYAQTFQAYTDREYRALLEDAGFRNPRLFPSLAGGKRRSPDGLFALVARK